jgi:hypothetical protein
MSKLPRSAPKPGDERWRRLSGEIERRDSSASRYMLYFGRVRLRGLALPIVLAVIALIGVLLLIMTVTTFRNLQQAGTQTNDLAQTVTAFARQADGLRRGTAASGIALTPTVAALQTQAAMLAATTTALAAPTSVSMPVPTSVPTPVPPFRARVVADTLEVFSDPITTKISQTTTPPVPPKDADVVLCHQYGSRYQIAVADNCTQTLGWADALSLELNATPFPPELRIPSP